MSHKTGKRSIGKRMTLEEKKCKDKLRQHELKNYFCYENDVLIALLNKFASITLKKAIKQSSLTSTLPVIISIKFIHDNLLFSTDDINLEELSEIQCSLLIHQSKDKENISQRTMMRRKEKNKEIFKMNLMMDILMEIGYSYESKLSNKTEKTIQLERINNIYNKGKSILNRTMIEKKGQIINEYLTEQLQNKNYIILTANDRNIQDMITT